jgi:hypothetical protein
VLSESNFRKVLAKLVMRASMRTIPSYKMVYSHTAVDFSLAGLKKIVDCSDGNLFGRNVGFLDYMEGSFEEADDFLEEEVRMGG